MYELIELSEQAAYLNCPAKIGVYRCAPDAVYLIDSGSDKDAGRKIRQILDKQHWTLKGILNTHSNADHIGGNRYLQAQTGCKIFAGGMEAAFTESPILEPSFLYGGYPCKELRHKFLMAQPSETAGFSDPDFPREVKVIPLPGHFLDMVGFRLPDGTVFLADCVSSAATLEKYAVSFIYDVEAYLQTLDLVDAMDARMFVPSHADAASDIRALVQLNREKVYEIAALLLDLCREPQPFEEILRGIFLSYHLAINFEQYALVGSTIRSYLSWLHDQGRLAVEFADGRLLWFTSING